MEMVLLLSTIINFITLLTLVIVVASYLSMKIREKKQANTQPNQTNQALTRTDTIPSNVTVMNTPPIPLQVSVALSQSNSQSLENTSRAQHYYNSGCPMQKSKQNGSWRLGLRSTL